MDTILELNEVSYIYKGKHNNVQALTDVSAGFERGKVYAITGKSGSGKTTMLSLMVGLDKPTSGDIRYEGESLSNINLDQYRKYNVSVVYQDFHLFPSLNALENVAYPLELQKVKAKIAREKAAELLDTMDLESHCHKHYPNMLSGGERQRVAIARALASNPKIIFADEPTGNLDSENSGRIIEILCNLAHKENYCVIIVTHDKEIADTADKILILKDGHIVL